MRHIIFTLVLSAMTVFAAPVQKKIPEIGAGEVGNYVGRKVQVRMEIRQTGRNPSGPYLEFYSTDHWSAPGNLFVRLTENVEKQARRWIGADPVEYFKGRTILVTGTPEHLHFGSGRQNAHYEIIVESSENIQVLPEEFSDHKIRGFTVRISKTLQSWNPREARELLNTIDRQLAQIQRLVRPVVLAEFRKVPIAVFEGHSLSPAAYQWQDTLIDGKLPQDFRGVTIVNIYEYLRVDRSKEQPLALLHEFAHSYHNLVLGGDSFEPINAAYKHAMDNGLYDKVQRKNAPDQPAYAKTNAREYFCEITEAWFGANDFYPFNREQLKQHDPMGWQLMHQVWDGSEIPQAGASAEQ